MPFYPIDDFDAQILNLELQVGELFLEDFATNGTKRGLGNGLENFGIFCFYQNDIDGICSMFILEHHKRFRKGLKLTSYPITNESDVYTFIKKSLAIKSAYPSLQNNAYLRVILLGINGWNEQLLFSVKLYFEQLLPEEFKRLLKIAVLTATRPISFFNTSHNDEWYFFLQDEADVQNEIQNEHLNNDEENVVINGIYKINSIAYIIESVIDCVNECDKAIILFASCIGVLSTDEFNDNKNINLSSQIISNRDNINSLQGGPYIKYDTDKLLTPLITLSSFEESLKISPYILMYDPNVRTETLSDIRICCNLKLDEYTSQFANLPTNKQLEVLQLLKKKLDVRRNRNQLCWIRRTLTISALDIFYIILSILLKSFYSRNGNVVVMDFLYKILIERVYEESGYDRSILVRLKNHTTEFIQYIFKLINCKIKVVNVGLYEILTTVIYPSYSITQSCHLSYISYLILSVYSRRKAEGRVDHHNLLLFVQNPTNTTTAGSSRGGTTTTTTTNSADKEGGYVVFGYNSKVDPASGDVWPLVFKSVALESDHFVLDCLNPNLLLARLKDLNFVRNKIVSNMKVVLKVQYQSKELNEEL